MSAALLPRPAARPLSAAEEDLLGEVVRTGSRVCATFHRFEPGAFAEMVAGSKVLYRRWMLDALLVLRSKGPLSFNAIKRELGSVAGETLSSKLKALEGERLLARSVREEGGVRYALTPQGALVAEGVYALMCAKAEHAKALADRGYVPKATTRFEHDGEIHGDLARFRTAVQEFGRARLARVGPSAPDDVLAEARRYSRACVHKWQGPVLATLVVRSPLRFAELRAFTGAGDQALTNALRALQDVRSVVRLDEGAYDLAPLGRLHVTIGGAIILLLPRLEDPLRRI